LNDTVHRLLHNNAFLLSNYILSTVVYTAKRCNVAEMSTLFDTFTVTLFLHVTGLQIRD